MYHGISYLLHPVGLLAYAIAHDSSWDVPWGGGYVTGPNEWHGTSREIPVIYRYHSISWRYTKTQRHTLRISSIIFL